ncbi:MULTISPECIES: helix-turn-helix domain-containing protein [unclassified Micromonospora]|uniref:TetR/AcrR family transcriptional regulator n=1 Tax=unclassified Micromonospora TaxID=2617518 RepID=UPI00331D1633
MGRPRGFDEDQAVQAAIGVFAERGYDGTSVDDLVASLGVHRNSLYKTFGSKGGLYTRALRWHVEHQVRPLVAAVAAAGDIAEAMRRVLAADAAEPGFDLLLRAAVERAPVDPEIAEMVNGCLGELDEALGHVLIAEQPGAEKAARVAALTTALTATVLGLRLRARAGASDTQTTEAGGAVAHQFSRHEI